MDKVNYLMAEYESAVLNNAGEVVLKYLELQIQLAKEDEVNSDIGL